MIEGEGRSGVAQDYYTSNPALLRMTTELKEDVFCSYLADMNDTNQLELIVGLGD